jgi:hypothetical protein
MSKCKCEYLFIDFDILIFFNDKFICTHELPDTNPTIIVVHGLLTKNRSLGKRSGWRSSLPPTTPTRPGPCLLRRPLRRQEGVGTLVLNIGL